MTNVNLGKIAFSWKGAYSSGATYKRQDVVHHNGDSFVALVDGLNGVTPGTDPTKWDDFAKGIRSLGGAPGSIIYNNGTTLVALPPGPPGTILKVDPVTGLPAWGASETRSGVRVKALPTGPCIPYRRAAVIMEDGSLRFWGNMNEYQSGVGNTTSTRSYPVRSAFPFGAAGMEKLYMNYAAVTRAIDSLGKLWQWGANQTGQCGAGDLVAKMVPYCSSDNPANSISGKVITQVANQLSTEGYSYSSTLVLASDGTVHGCGYNAHGQLGMGDTTQRTVFAQLPVLSGITKVAAGRDRYTSYYAIKSDGTLYAWGYNTEGNLGHGNTTQTNTPTPVAFFVTGGIAIRDVIPCLYGCFAIATNDDLYFFGTPTYGNGGTGAVTIQNAPVKVSTNVRDVYTSQFDYQSTFIVKKDNTVWSAGYNGYGQLALGNTTQVNSFTQVAGAPANVKKIMIGGTASYGYTLLVTNDGRVLTAGYNGNGQLGLGDVTARNTFQVVPIARRTVVDACTYGYTSEGGIGFLLDDGQFLMCGYGGESMNSDQAANSTYVPTPVVF